jgi:large subunit ribosomal protein L15
VNTVAINVGALERFDAGAQIDEQALREARLVQGVDVRIKILGDGKLTKKLSISAHRFSKSALEKIEQAGGKAITLGEPPAEPAKEQG